MKSHTYLTILLITFFSIFGAQAQAQLKVAVVDAAKVLKDYYKTQEAQARIKVEMERYQKELNDRRQSYSALVDQIRTLQEAVKDTTLSQEKRQEKQNALNDKVKEAGMREQENRGFVQNATKAVQEQGRRANQAIMEDMSKTINAISKAGGYNLVFVKAEFPSPVLYSDVPDISADVLRELNKTKPASSASAAPRPAAIP